MRLKFNILSFDDNPDFLETSIFNHVREHLEKSGFEMNNVGIHKNSKGLEGIIIDIEKKKKDVDLILMDYLLMEETGDSLIRTIRDHRLYTDIIFYSQNTENLPGEIREQLQGIYYSSKNDLAIHTIRVIDNLIKKALDLSNFRGLFMAETSELDDLMHHIIITFLEEGLLKDPAKAKKTIKEKAVKSLTEHQERFEKINETEQLLLELESSHKARAVERLKKEFITENQTGSTPGNKLNAISKELSSHEFKCEEFTKKILSLRNKLAHVKEAKNEEGEKILKSIRPGKDDFIFDENESLKARNNLKKYFQTLAGIYKIISGKEWSIEEEAHHVGRG